MYINKRIEIALTQEETEKIEEFRCFLQNASAKIRNVLPSLYKRLEEADNTLYDILYRCFDEEIDLDD